MTSPNPFHPTSVPDVNPFIIYCFQQLTSSFLGFPWASRLSYMAAAITTYDYQSPKHKHDTYSTEHKHDIYSTEHEHAAADTEHKHDGSNAVRYAQHTEPVAQYSTTSTGYNADAQHYSERDISGTQTKLDDELAFQAKLDTEHDVHVFEAKRDTEHDIHVFEAKFDVHTQLASGWVIHVSWAKLDAECDTHATWSRHEAEYYAFHSKCTLESASIQY